MDWSAVAVIASAVSAVAAAIGVCIAGYQISKSSRIAQQTQENAKRTQGIDVLLRLKDEWDSEGMQQKKVSAASLLLRNLPDRGTDVADVLDFFETVAVFLNRNVIDPYLVWHTFYWWMVNFYAAARALTAVGGRDYIADRRDQEGEKQWKDLEDSIRLLLNFEGRKNLPSAEEIIRFLRDEAPDGIASGYVIK